MWVECWRLILSKRIQIKVIKIPRSHASDAMINMGIMEAHDKRGNDQADRLAELGAALAKQPEQAISLTNKNLGLARYIQLRLAQATTLHVSDQRRTIRAQAPPPTRTNKS